MTLGPTVLWLVIVIASLGCYLLKVAGLSVPASILEDPRLQRVAILLPVTMLAALVVVQTFASDSSLVLDARVAGVGAGAVALLLRAPFLVVVGVAAVTAAALRALTG